MDIVAEKMVGCARCGKPMPAERLEFGLKCCKECTPQRRPLGVAIYDHKTAGVLDITDSEEVFRAIKNGSDSRVEDLSTTHPLKTGGFAHSKQQEH